MTQMNKLAAACAPLLLAVALVGHARPVPPSLTKELPVCEKLHGNAPKLPVATDYPGGISPKGGALTPAELPGVRTVNPKVVACLIEAMGSELAVFAPMKDETGIPDAFAWPGVGMTREPTPEEKESLGQVFDTLSGGRKDRPIVVYCHSTECFLSYNALIHLKNAGYTNLLWMREGIKGWKEAGLPVDDVRMRGYRKRDRTPIPQVAWDAFGMRDYPTPPNYYGKHRDKAFKAATGVSVVSICMDVADGDAPSDPHPSGIRYEYELRLYRAAGVDPDVDNEFATRRKMQAFWDKHGDFLECSELHVGVKNIFKHAVLRDREELVERAMYDWKLPVEHFNKVDYSDGRTLLDYVASYGNKPGEDVTALYWSLRKYGAKTHAELVAEGKLPSLEALQADTLKQYVRLADAGDISAMFHLSWVYRNGEQVARNWDEGMKWWHRAGQRAIETSDYPSMISIATTYYFPDPMKRPGAMPEDNDKAGEWFRRAAAGDTKETNFWMGRVYLDGIGVEKDRRRALPYFERALEQGTQEAIPRLAEIWIDLGDKHKAAYYMRSWGMVMDIKGRMNVEWFKILDVPFCGKRAQFEEIVCDGTNDKPPGMVFQ